MIWSTTAEIQGWIGYRTTDATIAFLRRHGLQPLRLGRTLLWRTATVRALIAAVAANNINDSTATIP